MVRMVGGSVEGLDSATVDHQGLAADPGGDRSSEVEDRSCDIGDFSKAMDRCVGKHFFLDLRSEHCGEGMRTCGARSYVIDTYAHRSVVKRKIGCKMI